MRILLVEDNLDIAGNISDYLTGLGHQLDYAENGEMGLTLATTLEFDAIILDVNLPKKDGFTLCRELRSSHQINTPVMMLTARGSLSDKTAGFQAGAWDYLVKPFALQELGLRLDALVLKSTGHLSKKLTVGELTLDLGLWQLRRNGMLLTMHKASLQLLEVLLRASPHVVSRQELEYLLWGDLPPPSNPLRSHIHEIRKTIDKPFASDMLRTVKGVGYQLIHEADDEN